MINIIVPILKAGSSKKRCARRQKPVAIDVRAGEVLGAKMAESTRLLSGGKLIQAGTNIGDGSYGAA